MTGKGSRSRFALPELGKKTGRRPARVADSIKNEIAMLLLRKVKDPRLYNVTITAVEITSDLRLARVKFSCFGQDPEKVGDGLASARGFMRSHLARELGLRYVPDLEFVYDVSLERQAEMDKLFREIAEKDDQAS
ncbi:MAG: 30S ribosome-binding factor RbfA [Proteobacteria bacterium]|nr:30S ribosome-binding factor RbfA [Pseudomonadota bacterium]MBU1737628.1 30S ribosome-binding factor RbfA [Pseudomonadota bacterium]